MRARDIVVIGASAGGVEGLMTLVRDLPEDLAAAVFVVLHIPAAGPSLLAAILDRHGHIPAHTAVDGEGLDAGHIYVAPPDCHLLLEDGRIELARGPKENGHRPAVDTLFRSAAVAYGERVVGVVLSGMLDDGAAGLRAVKEAGGAAIVLDPSTTVYTGMPASAIAAVAPDAVVPITDMAATIVHFVTGRGVPPEVAEMPDPNNEAEQDAVEQEGGSFRLDDDEHDGRASGFVCPECGGALWEAQDDQIVRFRCHVGHAYSLESMLDAHAAQVDRALFGGLRALREKAALSRRVAERMDRRGSRSTAERLRRTAAQAEDAAATMQQLVEHRAPGRELHDLPSPSSSRAG